MSPPGRTAASSRRPISAALRRSRLQRRQAIHSLVPVDQACGEKHRGETHGVDRELHDDAGLIFRKNEMPEGRKQNAKTEDLQRLLAAAYQRPQRGTA